jgi:aminopeptidase
MKKTNKLYQPSQKIIDRYADVMVNFAAGRSKGIKKGDVVRIAAEESAKPLYMALRKAVWKAGGHVIGMYLPSDKDGYRADRDFYETATDEQIAFFPKVYLEGLVKQMDHSIYIISEDDKQALKGVDPKKMMLAGRAHKPYKELLDAKESAGKFTWTLALYGTEAMAKEAGMTLEKFWKQIIKACFLDQKDPIAKWKKVYSMMQSYLDKLNALPIETLNVKGPDADLTIKLGKDRKFIGGRGANIPCFELFTSPDWRGTEGWIRFDQPLYRYGNLIKGVELHFKAGRVIKSSAKVGEKVLKEMITTEGADKVGEFSLTDKRFSRITRFMAETLYDENVGGPNGNTHIALGSSYHDTYTGNESKVTKAGWAKMGFNDSSVHTDIVSTAPRTVTATLRDGSQKVIYKDGMFVL